MRLQPKNAQENATNSIIAIGSNLRDGLKEDQPIVGVSLELLSRESLNVLKVSSWYQTPAFPPGTGPDFVNGAALISSRLSASELLECLHEVENELGRTRTNRWEPRVIDLDLIAHGAEVAPDRGTFKYWYDLPLDVQMQVAPQELILPHPRVQDRPFVLVPLRDVAPEWVHPVTGKTVSEMLANFSKKELSEIRRIEAGETAP